MGNKMSKKKREPIMEVQSQQVPAVQCQICGIAFKSEEINQHMEQCQEQILLEEEMMLSQVIEQQMAQTYQNQMITGTIDVKIPTDSTHTKFQWRKAKIDQKYNDCCYQHIQEIKKQPFACKYVWLKHQMRKYRSDEIQQSKIFRIDTSRLVESSLVVMREVEPNCEIKIQFLEEKTQDAGGLMREWISMLIKEICSCKEGLFQKCQTSESLLRLKTSFSSQNTITLVDKFRLFGFILSRALIQSISLECQLCWPLLRQLFKPDSLFELRDVYHYDQQLYRSLKFLRESTIDQNQLDLYFTYESERGIEELMEGGSSEKVSNFNKEFYIFALLKYLFTTKEEILIHAVRSQLFKQLPKDLFSIFEPYELQMLISGKPTIQLKQWRESSQYKGDYHLNHPNVKWFWNILDGFDQQQLTSLMKFISGSSRLSLQGFQKLSCNRGKSNKFQLCSVNYTPSTSLPQGFTCFNRLILPVYPTYQLQKQALQAVINSDFQGTFGLD